MKLLLVFTLLTIGAAQAGSIPSIADCKVTDRAKIWTGTVKVENTRVINQGARARASLLLTKGAEVETTKDILGIPRYETVELRTVLEKNGTNVDSCEGVYYAVKSEICTVDSNKSACETFCKIEWLGEDCR